MNLSQMPVACNWPHAAPQPNELASVSICMSGVDRVTGAPFQLTRALLHHTSSLIADWASSYSSLHEFLRLRMAYKQRNRNLPGSMALHIDMHCPVMRAKNLALILERGCLSIRTMS